MTIKFVTMPTKTAEKKSPSKGDKGDKKDKVVKVKGKKKDDGDNPERKNPKPPKNNIINQIITFSFLKCTALFVYPHWSYHD